MKFFRILFVAIQVFYASFAFSETYYVSPTGDNNNPGTMANPWQTIHYGIDQMAAGDTLHLKNGVYREQVSIQNLLGNPGNPTVIEGEARAGVIIRGLGYDPNTQKGLFPYDATKNPSFPWYGFYIINASHWTIRNLTIQGTLGSGVFGENVSGLTIEDVTVNYCGNSALEFNLGADIKVLNCTVDRSNLITWLNVGAKVIPTRGQESVTFNNIQNFEIAYSLVRNSFQEGIDAKFQSSGKIHHNTVEFVRSVGIYLNEASNCEVYENIIRDIFYYQLEDGAIVRSDQYFGATTEQPNQYGYSFSAASLEHGGQQGISVGTGDLAGNEIGVCRNNRIYNNVIYRVWRSGMNVKDALVGGKVGVLDSIEVFNNTVFDCNRSSKWTGFAYMLSSSMTNSIFQNNIGMGGDRSLLLLNSADITVEKFLSRGNMISHNLFWDWESNAISPDELANEPNTLLTDPRFVSANSTVGAFSDLHLHSASPAIDNGIAVGLPFTGSAPDIGAYEFNAPVSVGTTPFAAPDEFALRQNYPNPFNPSTTIRFSISQREHVMLKLFDVLGREIATLLDDELAKGEHSVFFDAENLTSGVYFYRLTAGSFTQIRRAILMK